MGFASVTVRKVQHELPIIKLGDCRMQTVGQGTYSHIQKDLNSQCQSKTEVLVHRVSRVHHVSTKSSSTHALPVLLSLSMSCLSAQDPDVWTREGVYTIA